MIPKLLSFFLLLAVTLQATAQLNADSCSMPALPSIHFSRESVFLNAKAKAALDSAVVVIKKFPKCKVKVTGYGVSNYVGQQSSWDKVESVVNYLVDDGVNKDMIIFVYGESGNMGVVDLTGTSEDGPPTVPCPHPSFSRHKYISVPCPHPH